MFAAVLSRQIPRPIASALGALVLAGALPLAGPAAAEPPQAPRAVAQGAALAPEKILQLVHGREGGHRSRFTVQRHRWEKRHGHHRKAKRHFHRRHPGHSARGHYGRRACHPVRHLGHHRGHRALLGAVICYDRRGGAYVLRGSRHVIRYLFR